MKTVIMIVVMQPELGEQLHLAMPDHCEIIVCDHEINIEPSLPYLDMEISCRLDALLDYDTYYDIEETVKHSRVDKIGVESNSKAKRIRLPRGRR